MEHQRIVNIRQSSDSEIKGYIKIDIHSSQYLVSTDKLRIWI